MNYNLIINAWDPEAGEQCRRLTRFLQDIGLASEKGNMIILSEEESEESWGTLTELVPAGSVSVLYGEFYRPEPVLDLLSEMTDADDICIFPGNHVKDTKPDVVEMLPAGLDKMIRYAVEQVEGKPLVASGLVLDEDDVRRALSAGAIAISTTNLEVWKIMD